MLAGRDFSIFQLTTQSLEQSVSRPFEGLDKDRLHAFFLRLTLRQNYTEADEQELNKKICFRTTVTQKEVLKTKLSRWYWIVHIISK